MSKKLFFFIYGFIGAFIFISCHSTKAFKNEWTYLEAPTNFKARFETSKGSFDIEAHRKWSPKAVDRLYQLISTNYYTDIAIFRVVPNYVAQFGIHDDATLNKAWEKHKIVDEPSIEPNIEGTIAFARGGKESRTTQLFINLKNNSPRLDTLAYNGVKGFPVLAKVIRGMDVVKKFYDGYEGEPSTKQDIIQKKGNRYLKKSFPKLDYIKRAYIIK